MKQYSEGSPQKWGGQKWERVAEKRGLVEIEETKGYRIYYSGAKRVGFRKRRYFKEGMLLENNIYNYLCNYILSPLDFNYNNISSYNIGWFKSLQEVYAYRKQHWKFWWLIEYLDKEFLQLNENEKELMCEHLLNMDDEKLERFIRNWIRPSKSLRSYMQILQNGYSDEWLARIRKTAKLRWPRSIWVCVVCGNEFEARKGRLTCDKECKQKRQNQLRVHPAKTRLNRRMSRSLYKILKGEKKGTS